VGPNVGQGGVNTEGMSKTQIATALSQVFASEDKRDLGTSTSLYEVDFLSCIKGFVSRRAKNNWGLETKEVVKRICTTLERFMDYLLQHDSHRAVGHGRSNPPAARGIQYRVFDALRRQLRAELRRGNMVG
jgi:hypothetical protein